MDAGEVEAGLLRSLGAWSAVSVIGGAALWAAARHRGAPAAQAFARQQAAWGGVDAAVAAVGALRRRTGGQPTPSVKLRRLLLLNTALDVGYVAGGLALVVLRERVGALPRYSSADALGDGLGILVQGGFLLLLDASHAARLDS